MLAFWDSDDEDASGMPKLKKPLFQMTVTHPPSPSLPSFALALAASRSKLFP